MTPAVNGGVSTDQRQHAFRGKCAAPVHWGHRTNKVTACRLYTNTCSPGRPVRAIAARRCKSSIHSDTRFVDFWAFDARDPGTYLSMEHTRSTLSRLTPRIGDILVDNWRDPCSRSNRILRPAYTIGNRPCDRARYVKLGCAEGHASASTICIERSNHSI